MLFIEEYTEAKKYHKQALDCWFRIKLIGRNTKTNKKGHKCNDSKCIYCTSKLTKFPIYKDTIYKDTIIKLLHKNIDILLYGSLSELMKLYKDNRVLFDKERGVLSTFFNESAYKNYFQKEHGLNFLNKLNIGTCIYCNRNYTLQITSTHSRAQIDHWLPKTYFPFAALNFFNLIPSCQSCNHIKGSGPDGQWWINNWEHLIHPYSKEAMFKFNYSFNESMNKLSVELDGLDNDRIKTLASFNKIKEIYNAHSEFELRDLYDLRLKYSKNYLNHLLEKTFETNVSMEEKYRLLFGMEKKEDNYHLRPFSKFKNEIIEELFKEDENH